MAKALVVYYSRKGENHMPGGIQVLEKGNTAYDRTDRIDEKQKNYPKIQTGADQ